MKNLTGILKKIIASNVNWSVSLFYLVLETLRDNNLNLSFWEGEENWASILINNKVVGYIWRKYPLVVVEKKISSEIKYILKDIEGIYFIEVDLLNVDLFKIEDESIKVYFENFNNFNSFTMEELWFQTNSVQEAAKTSTNAFKHSFKYADRVRLRAVQDPISHNFPYSFDDAILSTNPILKNNGYKIFQQTGTMNGKNGVFEIGLTKDGIIDHRFFRPIK